MVNYYDILEISENASEEVIQSAYRTLAKKYHPDTYKGDLQYANSIMQTINEAYDVLSDSTKRKLYDQQLKTDNQQTGGNETKETDQRYTQSKSNGTTHTADAFETSSGTKTSRGCCLSGCFSTIVNLCIWLVIIGGCLSYCSQGENEQHILNDLNNALTPKVASTPLSDLYQQIVDKTLQEAQEAVNEEERQSKFIDAFTLQASKYSFMASVYEHYVDDSYETQPFYAESEKEMGFIIDAMRQFYPEETIAVICYSAIDVTSEFFEGMHGEFDYMLGDEWTKQNIDMNFLWELYLSKTDILEYTPG